MTRVAIIQSSYLPWKGYFDIINDCDIFIFYDEVKYSKNGWRNRNRIKLQGEAKWLTVPVIYDCNTTIAQVKIANNQWQRKHRSTIMHAYNKCAHYGESADLLDSIYRNKEWHSLSELNQETTKLICRRLGIKTEIKCSTAFTKHGGRSQRLIDIIKAVGGTEYISGPKAKSYINENDFKRNNISITWKDYTGYPTYQQSTGLFMHELSIIDLIINTGKAAPSLIWGWR